ncbi:MAG: hypothetical protein NW214_10435 [Pseudanabaenaceae cyanobacterium bins.39]|nr:hypothetical protein [Pseudanabaenaceae cyanobacterium bins.39]
MKLLKRPFWGLLTMQLGLRLGTVGMLVVMGLADTASMAIANTPNLPNDHHDFDAPKDDLDLRSLGDATSQPQPSSPISKEKAEINPNTPDINANSAPSDQPPLPKPDHSPILILSPSSGSLLDIPSATVIIRFAAGEEVQLSINGRLVNNNAIGRTDLDTSTNTVMQTWYGVVLDDGENLITAKTSNGAIATTKVKVRGAASEIRVSTLETRIAADGRSTATIQGLLLDEKGDRSNRTAMVTLSISEGELIGIDAQPDQPGFQVEARNGEFSTPMKSSLNSGNSRIRASTTINNRLLEAYSQIQFETNLRPSIVTGVIDLRIGARGTDYYRSFRDFLPEDRNNSTNVDFYAAAFGTGRVGEWLVTGAFNTRRTLNENCEGRSRLFRDTQYCDQNYPVYGDSSTYTTETPSLTSIFLRAERTSPVPNAGTDFLMWGDFRTEEFTSRSQDFTAFTRQLNGLKLNYNFGDLQATGFYSNNTKGFQRDIIPPDGTSGFFFLSRRLITPGSENVFVEWEELLRPGTIARRIQLERSKDYEIDYDRGSLQFRQPIAQTDIGSNGETLVRRIVASYEYDNEGGSSNSVYGGQVRLHLNRDLQQPSWLGLNYYKENQGARNFNLYGANALLSFGRNGYVIGEYARSQNEAVDLSTPVSGSAIRFEGMAEVAAGIIAKAFYRHTDTGFVNNATISFVPGQTRYGLRVDAKLSDSTTIRASYDREENKGVAPQPFTLRSFLDLNPQSTPGTPVDNQLSTFSFGLMQRLGFATAELDLLMRDRQDALNTTLSGTSTQLRSKLTTALANNLKFIVLNETSLSNTADSILPDRTALVLDWQVIEGISFRLGQQWFSSGVLAGNSFTTAEVVGDYKLGTDTTISGRYSIVGGANNTTAQGAIGLNQRWAILPGIRLNFGYERIFGNDQATNASGTQVLQPLTTGVNTSTLSLQSGNNYNIGIEYTDNPDFKVSARYEYRTSSAGANTVITASALGKLSPAITGLFRYQRSGVANQTINNLGDTSSLRLGLAYRDPHNDNLNALLRYEYRQNPSTIPDSIFSGFGTGSESHVLSLEGIYAPTWQWEFFAKYAFRNSTSYIANDFVSSSSVNLAQLRTTYRLGYNFDLTGEARFINQPTAGYSETGYLAELGYYPTPNLRLALGYSSGAINNDRDFSGTRSAGGIYAAITVKLNELFDGFGLQSMATPQYKEPVDPQTPIELPAAKVPNQPNKISQNPADPNQEMMRVALAQPVQFPAYDANLSTINEVVLENLVVVMREYPSLNIEVQGNLASLTQLGNVASTEAQRLGKIRTYLLNNGITANRIIMRSLGAAANPEAQAEIYLSLGGSRSTFGEIATRIQQGNINSALSRVLPQNFLANAPKPPAPDVQIASISQMIEFAPAGRMTDVSNAKLDALLKKIADRNDIAIELKGNLDGSELEVNRLMGLRSYLMQKGISSDRILISPTDKAENQARNGISLVLASLDGLPIAQLPEPEPQKPPVAQLNNDNNAENNRLSLLPALLIPQESISPNLMPSGFQISQINLGLNNFVPTPAFLLGQLVNLDAPLAMLPSGINNFSPLLKITGNEIISLTPTNTLLLGQLLDPETYSRQPLALRPDAAPILSLLLETATPPILVSTAESSPTIFSFARGNGISNIISTVQIPLWSYTPSNNVLSLLLTEPSVIVADNNNFNPDLKTQRFIAALNFLMNSDRDVLTSWLNSLSDRPPDLRGELIKPEFFEEGQL